MFEWPVHTKKRKTYLGYNVLLAARARISWFFDTFPRIYLSFSGGKDSSVMFHICAEEARRRGRKFGLLFVDWECQYQLTIDHVTEMVREYADVIELYCAAFRCRRSMRSAFSSRSGRHGSRARSGFAGNQTARFRMEAISPFIMEP